MLAVISTCVFKTTACGCMSGNIILVQTITFQFMISWGNIDRVTPRQHTRLHDSYLVTGHYLFETCTNERDFYEK